LSFFDYLTFIFAKQEIKEARVSSLWVKATFVVDHLKEKY